MEGLTEAWAHLDSNKVNRMLLNNCGLSADELAQIIGAFSHMQDFKSLTVKQETFNEQCILNLNEVMKHRVPWHLQDLSIIDCRISPNLIGQLM